MRRQPWEGEKLIASRMSNKQRVSRVHKEPFQLNNRKTNHPIKKRTKDPNRRFSEEDLQGTHKHMNRCFASSVLRETQMKTTDTTSHKPEGLEYKMQMLAGAGEDAGKRSPQALLAGHRDAERPGGPQTPAQGRRGTPQVRPRRRPERREGTPCRALCAHAGSRIVCNSERARSHASAGPPRNRRASMRSPCPGTALGLTEGGHTHA